MVSQDRQVVQVISSPMGGCHCTFPGRVVGTIEDINLTVAGATQMMQIDSSCLDVGRCLSTNLDPDKVPRYT